MKVAITEAVKTIDAQLICKFDNEYVSVSVPDLRAVMNELSAMRSAMATIRAVTYQRIGQ